MNAHPQMVNAPTAAADVDTTGSADGHLIVAWQHPQTRLIAPVGLLQHGADYRFRYLQRAQTTVGFLRFLSFPDWDGDYRSTDLFPLFSQRIMSARRPDYSELLHRLHLTDDASPWEQLARSEGRRNGDTVQVFPVPSVAADGSSECRFLVHGVRHVHPDAFPPMAVGRRLDLVDHPGNPVNPDAVHVVGPEGRPLGYVPDLLLEHLDVLRRHGPVEVTVEHVNRVEVPPHLRLLVRLRGTAPAGYHPLRGPRWATFV